MTLKLQSLRRLILIVCSILSLGADFGAGSSVDSAKASYTEALAKADRDRRIKLAAAYERCDKELAAALNDALTEQNLEESNRVQSLRSVLKQAATEPWSALPLNSSQAVTTAGARTAEREFMAASKKADASYNSLAISACRSYISALEVLSHEAIRDKKLDEANAIHAEKIAADAQLKLGPGKFPEGALLILTFDHDSVSGKGKVRALDLSGNGNDLLLGATRLAAGRVDGGLPITTDLSLHTIHNVGVGGRHPRTLSFWFHSGGGTGIEVLGWGGSGPRNQFRVHIASGEFMLWGHSEGNDYYPHAPVDVKQWHHHAITYDGTTMHWLIDGVEVGGGFNIESATPDTPFYVGGCDGVVDEIAVYDRVLTDDEIKQLRTRSIW